MAKQFKMFRKHKVIMSGVESGQTKASKYDPQVVKELVQAGLLVQDGNRLAVPEDHKVATAA